ncbi:MAG: hypothetical protein ACRD2L_18595, partial [Terriglobia bacterium]
PSREQNGAVLLESVTNQLQAISPALKRVPPVLTLLPDGSAIPATKLSRWQAKKTLPEDPDEFGNWEETADQIHKTRELLDTLKMAFQKPAFDTGFDYKKGFADFEMHLFVEVKKAGELLTAAAQLELKRGRLEDAAAYLNALLSLVERQKNERLIISQLVRHLCANLAFGVTWDALQATGWTEPQLKSFQDSWQRNHFDHDMATALEMERAMSLDYS